MQHAIAHHSSVVIYNHQHYKYVNAEKDIC